MVDPSWLVGRKIVTLVSYSPVLHIAELDNGGALDIVEAQVMSKAQYDAAKEVLSITCPYREGLKKPRRRRSEMVFRMGSRLFQSPSSACESP